MEYCGFRMASNLSNKNSSVAPVEEKNEQILWKLFFDFINKENEPSSLSKLTINKQTDDSKTSSND